VDVGVGVGKNGVYRLCVCVLSVSRKKTGYAEERQANKGMNRNEGGKTA
jgi:hypothetical protein